MVATDVASRGIGKYQSPLSSPHLQQLPAKALAVYFTLAFRGYLYCAKLPDHTVSVWFSLCGGVLIRCVAFPSHCYTRISIPVPCSPLWYKGWRLASLDPDQAVSPRLLETPFEDSRDHIICPPKRGWMAFERTWIWPWFTKE